MGWVVDREKERIKNDLLPNIASNITNIMANSNEIHDLAASINFIIGGVPSGTDVRWIGCCQRATNSLSRTSGLLHQAMEDVKKLFVMEWVDDGD